MKFEKTITNDHEPKPEECIHTWHSLAPVNPWILTCKTMFPYDAKKK